MVVRVIPERASHMVVGQVVHVLIGRAGPDLCEDIVAGCVAGYVQPMSVQIRVWMVDGEGRGRLVGKGERRVMVAQYRNYLIA